MRSVSSAATVLASAPAAWRRRLVAFGFVIAAAFGVIALAPENAQAQPLPPPGGGFARPALGAPPIAVPRAYGRRAYAAPAYSAPVYNAPVYSQPYYARRHHYGYQPYYGRRRGWDAGDAVAAGIFGLAAGAIIASASQPRYERVYVGRSRCTIRRKRIWIAPDTYKIRRVRVCY